MTVVMVMDRGGPGPAVIEFDDLTLQLRIIGGKELLEGIGEGKRGLLPCGFKANLHGHIGAEGHGTPAERGMIYRLTDHSLGERCVHLSIHPLRLISCGEDLRKLSAGRRIQFTKKSRLCKETIAFVNYTKEFPHFMPLCLTILWKNSIIMPAAADLYPCR